MTRLFSPFPFLLYSWCVNTCERRRPPPRRGGPILHRFHPISFRPPNSLNPLPLVFSSSLFPKNSELDRAKLGVSSPFPDLTGFFVQFSRVPPSFHFFPVREATLKAFLLRDSCIFTPAPFFLSPPPFPPRFPLSLVESIKEWR